MLLLMMMIIIIIIIIITRIIRRNNFSSNDSLSLCRDSTLSCCTSHLEVSTSRTFSRLTLGIYTTEGTKIKKKNK